MIDGKQTLHVHFLVKKIPAWNIALAFMRENFEFRSRRVSRQRRIKFKLYYLMSQFVETSSEHRLENSPSSYRFARIKVSQQDLHLHSIQLNMGGAGDAPSISA